MILALSASVAAGADGSNPDAVPYDPGFPDQQPSSP
jgi:hypothetical protein